MPFSCVLFKSACTSGHKQHCMQDDVQSVPMPARMRSHVPLLTMHIKVRTTISARRCLVAARTLQESIPIAITACGDGPARRQPDCTSISCATQNCHPLPPETEKERAEVVPQKKSLFQPLEVPAAAEWAARFARPNHAKLISMRQATKVRPPVPPRHVGTCQVALGYKERP